MKSFFEERYNEIIKNKNAKKETEELVKALKQFKDYFSVLNIHNIFCKQIPPIIEEHDIVNRLLTQLLDNLEKYDESYVSASIEIPDEYDYKLYKSNSYYELFAKILKDLIGNIFSPKITVFVFGNSCRGIPDYRMFSHYFPTCKELLKITIVLKDVSSPTYNILENISFKKYNTTDLSHIRDYDIAKIIFDNLILDFLPKKEILIPCSPFTNLIINNKYLKLLILNYYKKNTNNNIETLNIEVVNENNYNIFSYLQLNCDFEKIDYLKITIK